MTLNDEDVRGRFYRCPACRLPHEAGAEPDDCPLRVVASEVDLTAEVDGAATVVSDAPVEPERSAHAGMLLQDRFVLEERIGEGGMGAVYRARDIRVGRHVAVKTLHGGFDPESKMGRRFLREARLMSGFTHPGVARVMDFGIHGTTLAFLVMELLSGETLESRLDHEGLLDVDVACSIICQVLATLSVIHAEGIVHCDLKPANIFLTSRGGAPVAKLLDFGLSKETRASAGNITEAGVINGTPFYIAPKLLLGEKPSAATDLYSVGMMLFEMLTGEFPLAFEDKKLADIFGLVLNGERVRLQSRRPGIPTELGQVVDRAVQSEPYYESAAHLLRAIDRTQGDTYQSSELSRAIPMLSGERELPEVDDDDSPR